MIAPKNASGLAYAIFLAGLATSTWAVDKAPSERNFMEDLALREDPNEIRPFPPHLQAVRLAALYSCKTTDLPNHAEPSP